MAVATYNLKLEKGVYYETVFTFLDANSSAINLTGFTFKAEVRRKSTEELESSFTCTITEAVNGKMKMSMAASATEVLPDEDELMYDLLAKDSATNVHRYIKGKVTVTDTITDPSF